MKSTIYHLSLSAFLFICSCHSVASNLSETPKKVSKQSNEIKESHSEHMKNSIENDSMRFVFHTSSLSNLLYQLDCLSGLITCSQEAFFTLWQDTLSFQEEDQQKLAIWQTIRMSYQQEDLSLKGSGFPFAYVSAGSPEGNYQKLRIFGFGIKTLEEYKTRLQTIMSQRDIETIQSIVIHFQPRFLSWWENTGKAQTEDFIKKLIHLFKDKSLLDTVENFAHFLGASVQEKPIFHFNFMANPVKTGFSMGEQIRDHAIIEVLENEAAERRVDVVIHELVHRLFESAQTRLGERFLSTKEAHSLAAYNLLNESVATALQATVIKRVRTEKEFLALLEYPMGFYANENIDRVAKAILPMVETMLKNGESVHDKDFVSRYIALFEKTLGKQIAHPALRLITMGLMVENQTMQEIAFSLQQKVQGQSTFYFDSLDAKEAQETFTQYQQLSGVFLLSKPAIETLSLWEKFFENKHVKTLRLLSKEHAGFVYAIKRSPKASFYLVIADSKETLQVVLDEFLETKEIAKNHGLLVAKPLSP